MKPRVPVAWRQLVSSRGRLAAAVAGITFAALLMLTHMGVSDAMFESAVIVHRNVVGDLVVTSAHYQMIIGTLSETIPIMDRIDGVIEECGGWPDACSAGRALCLRLEESAGQPGLLVAESMDGLSQLLGQRRPEA